MNDDICPLCRIAESAEPMRVARAADMVHYFPIGPAQSMRKAVCGNAVLVL